MPQNKSFKGEIKEKYYYIFPRENIISFLVFEKFTCINCLTAKKLLLNIFEAVLHFMRRKYDSVICIRGRTLMEDITFHKSLSFLRDFLTTMLLLSMQLVFLKFFFLRYLHNNSTMVIPKFQNKAAVYLFLGCCKFKKY